MIYDQKQLAARRTRVPQAILLVGVTLACLPPTPRAVRTISAQTLPPPAETSRQPPSGEADLSGPDYSDGYLRYVDRPLKPDDFRGDVPDKRPLEDPRIEAYSHIELRYDFRANPRRRGNRWRMELVDIEVHALFHRGKSWNALPANTALLNHHQGHFDLAEITAREAQRQLKLRLRPPRQLVGQGASRQEATEDLEQQIQRQLAGHAESLERDIEYFDQVTRFGTLPDIEARERQKHWELLERGSR